MMFESDHERRNGAGTRKMEIPVVVPPMGKGRHWASYNYFCP